MDLNLILSLIILIFSVVIHEVSHGVVADHFGDSTARDAGRLTLNPIPHIDPIGSIVLPLILWVSTAGQFVLGAAKPVPVNFQNLRNPKRDMALVALAGPASNIILSIACALPLRFNFIDINSRGGEFLLQVVALNLVLAIFNMIPIPPLDGSKVIASLLSDNLLPGFFALERFGFLLIILFVFSGLFQRVLYPILTGGLHLLIGA